MIVAQGLEMLSFVARFPLVRHHRERARPAALTDRESHTAA
jgi:hypothetical protein